MITELEIKNFKSIKELNIQCGRLNVFVGTNSSGKSTIQQAILFVGQNVEEATGLNGKYMKLGELEEVRCQYGEIKEIQVKITDESDHQVTKILRRDGETNKLRLTTTPSKKQPMPILSSSFWVNGLEFNFPIHPRYRLDCVGKWL